MLTELRPSLTGVRTASDRSGDQFENADRAVLLAESRPADVDDVVESLELDRSVDAQDRDARLSAVRRRCATSTVTVPCSTAGSTRMT